MTGWADRFFQDVCLDVLTAVQFSVVISNTRILTIHIFP